MKVELREYSILIDGIVIPASEITHVDMEAPVLTGRKLHPGEIPSGLPLPGFEVILTTLSRDYFLKHATPEEMEHTYNALTAMIEKSKA